MKKKTRKAAASKRGRSVARSSGSAKRTTAWHMIPDPADPKGAGLEVGFPTPGPSTKDRRGRAGAPRPDLVKEASHQVATLRRNRRIAEPGEPLKPGQTHAIEVDEHGTKRLVEKRKSLL